MTDKKAILFKISKDTKADKLCMRFSSNPNISMQHVPQPPILKSTLLCSAAPFFSKTILILSSDKKWQMKIVLIPTLVLAGTTSRILKKKKLFFMDGVQLLRWFTFYH